MKLFFLYFYDFNYLANGFYDNNKKQNIKSTNKNINIIHKKHNSNFNVGLNCFNRNDEATKETNIEEENKNNKNKDMSLCHKLKFSISNIFAN